MTCVLQGLSERESRQASPGRKGQDSAPDAADAPRGRVAKEIKDGRALEAKEGKYERALRKRLRQIDALLGRVEAGVFACV